MRTFIAIPLNAECRKELTEIQGALRKFGADVRWTSIPSIHVTLRFLGEIDPALLTPLGNELRASAVQARFRLGLEGLGAFPDLRRPRVIWCGLAGDLTILSVLQAEVEAACLTVGFAPEDRPFKPHLTLGRVQGRTNLQALVDYIRIGASSRCEFAVDRYHVYKSTLTPKGAIYDILDTVDLPVSR